MALENYTKINRQLFWIIEQIKCLQKRNDTSSNFYVSSDTIEFTESTANIKDNSVTFDKVQEIGSNTFLGRKTTGTGEVEELTIPEVKTLLDIDDFLTTNENRDIIFSGSVKVKDATDNEEAVNLGQLNLKADQNTTYTKTEINSLVSSTYKPKGSKDSYIDLPTTGQIEGDVWNLIDTGDNYVWVLDLNNTGIAGWDKLSGTVDLSNYETKTISESKYLQITNLSSEVLATLLTGISFLTGGAIVSTDSILIAFGKFQKNLTDIYTALTLKQDATVVRTGNAILFDKTAIYNSFTSPTLSQLSSSLTGAKLGIIQKIYIQTATFSAPSGWKIQGSGVFTPNVVNIIYAEWADATTARVEYWIELAKV